MSVFDNPRFFPELYNRIEWPRVPYGSAAPFVTISVMIDGVKKHLKVRRMEWNYNTCEEIYRFSSYQMFSFEIAYGTKSIEPIQVAFGATGRPDHNEFKVKSLTLSHRTTLEEAEHLIMMASLTLDSAAIETTL